MTYLDYRALEEAPLQTDPYDYLIVENFVKPENFRKLWLIFQLCRAPVRIRHRN